MRRRSFASVVVFGVFAAVGFAPTACDSTLNLGGTNDPDAAGAESGSAATCAAVCDKLIACGFPGLPTRSVCISSCVAQATQSLLDCVTRASCANVSAACGSQIPDSSVVTPPPFDSGAEVMFEIVNCQSACDQVEFFSCIGAADHASCRDLCVTTSSSKRSSFQTCANAAGGDCPKAQDCLRVFEGD